METVIYFVRHAEPNMNNHDDRTRELTAEGLESRKLVTKFLADQKIDAVLSSPYKRSVDTIRHFADLQGLTIETVEDFRERKVGNWIEDFDGFCKRQWENFEYKLPGGESLREVQERNLAVLKQVLKSYAGKNIVVGSHGTALSTIIHSYDASFGYDDFMRIKGLMPWVVRFTFQQERCIDIQKYNLFEMTF